MQTTTSLGFSMLLCSALLTSCIASSLDDVTTPDGSNAPDAAKPADPKTPSVGNFERWMKCMNLSDFRTAGMVNAWNETFATGDTTCEKCHENGAEGFIVTPNEQKFFDVIQQNKYYALQYFTYSAVTTPFAVTENRVAMTGVSTGVDPHRQHPRFDASAGLAASRLFAALTQARYDVAAGECP